MKQFETPCYVLEKPEKHSIATLLSNAKEMDIYQDAIKGESDKEQCVVTKHIEERVSFVKEDAAMKTFNKMMGYALAFSLFCAFPVMAKGPGAGDYQSVKVQTIGVLSTVEQDVLLWMREEEKVARDVYGLFYKTWKVGVFKNIATSEQRHMDALLKKIEQAGLNDPALPVSGQFSNSELQALYDQLTQTGQESMLNALRVGATIEDKDINDLLNAIAATKNVSLQMTYQNLLEGSKNHLRAFVGLLERQGVNYQPQFISQE